MLPPVVARSLGSVTAAAAASSSPMLVESWRDAGASSQMSLLGKRLAFARVVEPSFSGSSVELPRLRSRSRPSSRLEDVVCWY